MKVTKQIVLHESSLQQPPYIRVRSCHREMNPERYLWITCQILWISALIWGKPAYLFDTAR